ncbi:hypothetical protein EYF80_034939 [Liparis tanakae]|uniref:Uncharacterized protein n=1 Tax=Liparis tanakae TaxID=230148 RepID=A0A4Z2GNM8_9TELE|nr:hypothetical protein EYF80_034939 [Liparis tanakae]
MQTRGPRLPADGHRQQPMERGVIWASVRLVLGSVGGTSHRAEARRDSRRKEADLIQSASPVPRVQHRRRHVHRQRHF